MRKTYIIKLKDGVRQKCGRVDYEISITQEWSPYKPLEIKETTSLSTDTTIYEVPEKYADKIEEIMEQNINIWVGSVNYCIKNARDNFFK